MRTSDPQRLDAEQSGIAPASHSAEWPSWPQLGAPVSERDWGSRRRRASLARSAGIIAGSFVISRVLGLVREIVLARQFGTSEAFSAYVSAFRVPDLLFLVVMAGAFGAAFIPVFGEYLANGDQMRAWRLASSVLTWSGVSVFVLSTLCFLLARPLMRYVVAPGFDQQTEDLAVNLMRILLLSPVFL